MVARFSNIFITNSFAINPVSGGKPPGGGGKVDIRIVLSIEQTCLNGILYLFLVTISVQIVFKCKQDACLCVAFDHSNHQE